MAIADEFRVALFQTIFSVPEETVQLVSKKSIFLTPDNYTDLTLYSVLDLILEFGFFTHSVAYQFHNIHFLLFGSQRKSTLS